MTDFNLRAARIQLGGLVAALVAALLIAIAITAGAFTLSFEAQRDLATQALLPTGLTWIFPAIVDTAILGATIAVVTLNKITGDVKGKRFFLSLLIVVVLISVAGNAFHAYRSAEHSHQLIAAGVHLDITPLDPWIAALIAVIPPLLVLAFTHGCGVLIKAIGNAYTEYRAGVAATSATQTSPATSDDDVAKAVAAPLTSVVAPVCATTVEGQPAAEASVAGGASELESLDAAASGVAPGATAMVAEPAAVAPDVARLVALTEPVAEPVAVRATGEEEQRTVEELLAFIAAADLDAIVKETARLKISDPEMTFAALAERTGAKASSTALRRYKRAEDAAVAAGFTVPPLPDLDDHLLDTAAAELVMAR